MEKISHLVNKRLNQHKLGMTARSAEVVFKTNEHLSEWLSYNSSEIQAISLKNGVLWIGVKNSGLGQEVWGISGKLLKKLQEHFGKTLIQKIRTKSL